MKDILEDKDSAENTQLRTALKDSQRRESLLRNMAQAVRWLATDTPARAVPGLLVLAARLLMLSEGEDPNTHSADDAVQALKRYTDGMAEQVSAEMMWH